MTKHLVCFPSAEPQQGIPCATEWREKGYEPLVMVDPGKMSEWEKAGFRTILAPSPFPGYYKVANTLARFAFDVMRADVVTFAADDMTPPVQGARAVAELYLKKFPDGFGVLQATGDKQGEILVDPVTGTKQHNAGRICGSPTFGRGWYERGYGGQGPFCSDYGAFFADEDLQNVAYKYGVLWQNRDITILHKHWSWHKMPKRPYHEKASKEHWDRDKEIFRVRKEAEFPNSAPTEKGKSTTVVIRKGNS